MRRIYLASLMLSPLLLSAAALASSPASDANASTSVPQVSTGVTFPKVLYSTDIEIPSTVTAGRLPNLAPVVLELNVDQTGKVHDVQVVKSLNPELNANVVDAVRKFRFSPAKLDNQAIPVDMELTVLLQR
jgi:TonB family protein